MGWTSDLPVNSLSRITAQNVNNNAADLQERHELFLLGEGEKKVTETPETRTSIIYLFRCSTLSDSQTDILQASPMPQSFCSKKKTTHLAIFFAAALSNHLKSFSQHTEYHIHFSPTLNSEYRPMAVYRRKRPSSRLVRISCKIFRSWIKSSPRNGS